MAISDYSTTPGSNTAISGINIAEGWSPAYVNNAFRQLMADVRAFYDEWLAGGGGGGSGQPLDATLTAIAAVVTAADKLIYATGSDAFATTDLTAFGRSLIASSNAAAAISTLGAASATVSGTSTSGKVTIGTFVLTWRDHTFTANTSATYAYGAGHTYASWARAWCAGGAADGNAQDNNPCVTAHGTTSATVFSARDESVSGVLFSIGV